MIKSKVGKRLLSFTVVLILMLEILIPANFSLFAAEGYKYQGGAGSPVISDLDTSTKYSESLGDNASTEYAGRIWSDKSVYSGDATFATFGGRNTTIKLNESKNGEDFLVAFSVLATSESVEGQTQAPVDVVLIMDISGSMSNSDSNMDNGKSRIYNLVQAANDTIDKLMALNPYTRVSVVVFSNNATTLLPLDRYTKATTIERQWVQTGTFAWQGHWEETEVDLPYFSLSRDTASINNAVLYTNAVNSKSDIIEISSNVEGGTNIQVGLYEGMKILADEESTTANINGAEIQRIPSVILLSDGSPTYSSDSRFWWAPADNNNDGPGTDAYVGNGMKAILVGSYMKDAIDRNYGVAGSAYSTKVYTIGMGITNLLDDERDLAYITLNPGHYWNLNTFNNTMKTTIKNYWDSYTAGNNTGTLNINVGTRRNNKNYDKDYALTHPTTGYDVDPETGYDYVDGYYGADNASAVTDVFNTIVSNISLSVPQVPTELKGSDPISDGYITYTDPIGEYMEVKDVKAIIYAGETFTVKSTSKEDNVTRYVFEGEVHNPVYGDQEIKNIIVEVREANGKQTLTVKIPASVIPLRVNYVTLNADGSVKSHTNNGAFPTRVVYSVGLKDEILKESDGVVYLDKTKVSADYLGKNTNSDGTVNFYSNMYNNAHIVNGSAAGDAYVEFEPAHNNKFYYILEDMPIYTDSTLQNQLTASQGINDSTTYYYMDEFYHGTSVEVAAVPRTGAQLKKTSIVTGNDGYLYRAKGSPRTNHILEFEGTKTYNRTGTAVDFYAPTFVHAEGNSDSYAGKIVVYLGNNGKLSMIAGGNLKISKVVNAGIGLTAPDKTFEFTINLDGSDVNQGTYNYAIVNTIGDTVATGTVSASNNVIGLKDGETATIYSLPPETTYEVTEKAVDGFVVESQGATGIIVTNTTSEAVFTNTYNVETVTFPTEGELSGVKKLEGRPWNANDSFTFFITPYNNAPLPNGYDADKGVTVTAPDQDGGSTASFNFGTIDFTAPGIYRYTIVEKEPENHEYLPGMSYSRALYRVVVEVVDNGNGTLSVNSSEVQKLYDDVATPLFTYNDANQIVMNQGQEATDSIVFTNTYSADSVVRVPVALKNYTDNSGTNPLVSGMFTFELKAIGYLDDSGMLVEDSSNVPMPEGSVNGVVYTQNEGQNITFPSVEFTQDVIPEGESSITFRYEMKEVIPDQKVNGMEYDDSVYAIDVTVSLDPSDDKLVVDATYPNNERIVVFNNKYTQTPVKTDINGSKVLTGRNMKSGETFIFEILGANAATNNAVRDGSVVISDNTATVANGTDGNAVSFAFNDVQFNRAGTYIFAVSEVKGDAPAVEYDNSVVYVTVVVNDSDKNGILEITSITYSNGKNAAEFKNTYTSKFDDTPVSLYGTKNLTGKSLLAGEFFFNIVKYFNGNKVDEGMVSHTVDTTSADGVYTGAITFFENETYTAAGKYEYYITEQIPNPIVKGTTYDRSTYRYTVIVGDVDGVGKLTVTSKVLEVLAGDSYAPANEIVFNNKYVPESATATLPFIKKVVAGDRSTALGEGEFDFELSLVSADPSDGIKLPSETIKSNALDGSVVFDEIEFTKVGTYVVAIKEVIPAESDKVQGITYSEQMITATYKVTDDRSGSLVAVLSSFVGGNTIVNNYAATPAEAKVVIEKNFTGRENNQWLSTDKFDFEVVILDPATQEAVSSGAIEFPLDEGDDIVKKTISKKGETVNGLVKINKAGVYKFIVREIAGDIPGVHYDSTPREIVIVATDNSETATIDITINNEDVDSITLTFNNDYNPESTELSGHDNLVIEKNFTGRHENEWLDTDKFVFNLEAGDDDTLKAIDEGVVVLPADTELIVSNTNKAYPHFGNIVFHEEGEYKFKVTEEKGVIPGVEYDTAPRYITVKVKNNASEGTLVATITDDSDDLEFNNTYIPREVVLEGSAKLDVVKSLSGRDWFDSDNFKFKITPYGSSVENAVANGDIVMPAMTEITINNSDVEALDGYTDAFGDIVFKKPGVYRFAISEVAGDIENIDYDTHHYSVTVIVTDSKLGYLITDVAYEGTKIFINKYTASPVEQEIVGQKELTGNRPIKADDFEFVISAVTEGAPMPTNATVKNDANGKVDFGKIAFHQEGTYVYEIKETEGNIPGVSYDSKKVTVTIVVAYDRATGTYNAETSYLKEGEDAGDSFKFVNEYKAESSEPIELSAKKKVTPSEGNSYTLKGGEFTFAIEGSQGAPMPEKVEVTNGADGSVSFGSVKFTEDGTYVYTIHEVQSDLPGFTYDGSVYTVTVTVTDDIENAKLVTAVKVTDADGRTAEALFDNKYTPKDTSAIIFGNKVLESDHKELEADKFEFVISAVTENAPLPAETTVTNEATGLFQFAEIIYNKVGSYVYEVSEKNTHLHGYTYDDTVYTVTVNVTDEGNGQLIANVEGVGTTEDPAVKFVNSYAPDPTSIVLGAEGELNKVLEGRDIRDNEFIFALLDSEGTEIISSRNNADGKFSFALDFERTGTYNYTIVEYNNDVAGVEYDDSVYNVEIVVSDRDGRLEVTGVNYMLENETVDEVVFTNTYTAAPTDIRFNATKTLKGRYLRDGEFKFVVADKDGVAVTGITNDAEGNVIFDKIYIDEAGTYEFVIYEESGSLEHIIYDETKYVVKVEVIDDGNGQLKASTPVITKQGNDKVVEEMVFENVFDVTEHNPETGDSNNMALWITLLAVCGVGVGALMFYIKKREAESDN